MPNRTPSNSYQPKRDSFYFLEGLYTKLVCKTLPRISQLGITPNQVTFLNIANALAIALCLTQQLWLISAALIQLYLILDILDGNLARYAKLSSRFGQILDQIADRLFYTVGFLVLGYCVGNSISWLVTYAITINAYAAITTFYILPRLRALKKINRWGLKKKLMDRKIILGMDLSTQDLIASLLLLTPWKPQIIPLISGLYLCDLLYRLWELRRNERLNEIRQANAPKTRPT